MAMFIAISVVLVWLVHFPIFPAQRWLEYDPADIPILIATFAFGPLAGITLTVIASVIQGFTVSAVGEIYGIIMHILATGTLVLVAGNIYRFKKTRGVAAIGLICGVIAMTIIMVLANLIITPFYSGVPIEVVKSMLIPIIIPFNLIKAGINGAVAFVLYKTISRFIKGEKESDKAVPNSMQ